jgi:hemolysin III
MSELPDAVAPKPRLRGMLHAVGLVAALAVGAVFVATASGHRIPATVFAASVVVMLGTSTLYHLVTWTGPRRLWMRRADHAGIYLLIAGTYTPVGILALHGYWQKLVLGLVWGGALMATLLRLWWVDAPKWLSVALGVGLGWIGLAALPKLAQSSGAWAVVLLLSGGVAYTVGGVVYARRRPDPRPAFFGYHEVFHALTLVALAFQYVAIAFFVVRVG